MPCRIFVLLVLMAMIVVFLLVVSEFRPSSQPKKHAHSAYVAPAS